MWHSGVTGLNIRITLWHLLVLLFQTSLLPSLGLVFLIHDKVTVSHALSDHRLILRHEWMCLKKKKKKTLIFK